MSLKINCRFLKKGRFQDLEIWSDIVAAVPRIGEKVILANQAYNTLEVWHTLRCSESEDYQQVAVLLEEPQ